MLVQKNTVKKEDTDKIENVIIEIGKNVKQITSALDDKKITFSEGIQTIVTARKSIKYVKDNWAEIRAEKNDLDSEEIAKLGALSFAILLSILEDEGKDQSESKGEKNSINI